MIQWIALAVAVDAEANAARANGTAMEANHAARSGGFTMVIVRPVDLVRVPNGEPTWKFLGLFPVTPKKEVLATEPWTTVSLKRSDILHIEECEDADGAKFCRLEISKYAYLTRQRDGEEERVITGLLVPGSIEEVAGAIGT